MASRSAKGTSLPMTDAACSRRLSSGSSLSMREASTACTVGGICKVSTAFAMRYWPRSPRERADLDQGLDALLEEERDCPRSASPGAA